MAINNSLVSIIITTKNEEKNIGRLLESIKNQSYKKIEVIVVDNKSVDKTKVISKKYTNDVYDFGPERSAQRNYGASKAKGAYLIILDADMELSKGVVSDCVTTAKKEDLKAIVIPEKTVGSGFIAKVRNFERQMYMGDLSIEVARVFDRKVFNEFSGYDINLTGPEDYDLPYRISKKYKIGRSHEYILHHEEGLTLAKLLQKKYYYASQGARYANKHPELVMTQGNLLFRKAYLKNWKQFLLNPILGVPFIVIRILETIWAIAGYISAVGYISFLKQVIKIFV